MKISGFSFVRNGIKFDYPFVESIRSILPICDEFVVAVGDSEDGTLAKLRSLHDRKINIIETVWDESLRIGGAVLAKQTDIALSHTTGDWAFYLQGDEVVHEQDLPIIQQAMVQYCNDARVEGLLFNYVHFYGSYRYIGHSRRWYRREIRMVRNGIGVQSWGDAQGFRIGSRKMSVKPVNASIYHYGWVKPPRIQQEKQLSFNRLWHHDSWVATHVNDVEDYDYSSGGRLTEYTGTHPAVMNERVAAQNWDFTYDPKHVRQSSKERFLNWIEEQSGHRLAEYRNYVLI